MKSVQAMKIMDSFGIGGSFTEYDALDWKEDVVLMGHDGPGHCAVGVGHIAQKLDKLAQLLGITVNLVC
jgi:L-arabinose isomerase